MTGHGCQLSWSVLVLLVQSASATVSAKNDASVISKGSCSIGEGIDSLTCGSSVLTSHSSVSYVPEETYCRHLVTDTCYVCLKGVLSESNCPQPLLLREKRGLFDKSIRNFFKQFFARLIVCKAPASPANGEVKCPQGTWLNRQCLYSCHDGYRLVGSETTTCTKDRVFTQAPRCQRIQCGRVTRPDNAVGVRCSNGYRHRSVCSIECRQGYVPAAGSRSVCGDDGQWNVNAWKCQDIIKPVFTTCPTKKINTIDRRFTWSVAATDNTGKVSLTQIQGNPPGSLLEYGAHLIKYMATDTEGNKAYCSFVVELKRTDCPRPSSNDTDIQFICNGLTAQSYCEVSCKSGSFVEGSKYIVCQQDKSQNNTSTWQPVEGVEATCRKRSCSPLNTPKNGALACDKKLGGTICQIQCNKDFDVPFNEQRFHTFVCTSNSDTWKPRNTAPDCLEMAFPDEYYLPTDFFYYLGDCSDKEAMKQIKQQFIDNLNSIGISPCMSDVCSVDDVELSCGEKEEAEMADFWSRRKRSSSRKVLHIRLTFRLKNSNRTLSPEAATALLKSFAEKSKNLMSTNNAMRRMLFKTLPKPTLPPVIFKQRTKYAMKSRGSSSIGGLMFQGREVQPALAAIIPTLPPKVKSKSIHGILAMHCAEGTVQRNGVCVPCATGTYASNDNCIPCGLNTYQDNPGSSLCTRCPLHHITLSTGAASSTACKELCKQNTFSLSSVEPCYPCPEGKYQPGVGGQTCIPCPDPNPARPAIPKCTRRVPPANGAIASRFHISSFLLTCDAEVCLSF